MSQNVVVRIENATVIRSTGEPVFTKLSWTVREGETWAIVGKTGSGKTALTELLQGRLRFSDGSIEWPLVDRLWATGRVIAGASEIIACVAFKEQSRHFSYSQHYYQQRYNFIEPHNDLTLNQFLCTDSTASDEQIRRVTSQLDIADLGSLSFIKLSNGQTRRARIAKALLSRPETLILDEPEVGLDADGRAEVNSILRQLVEEGVRLILITAPDAIPSVATHVLELSDRRVTYSGKRCNYSAPMVETIAAKNRVAESVSSSEPIVEMRDVSVVYGDKPILRKVSWTVRKGERWAVLGPNGSGKTTLLSLICGDHPQAYSNDICVFGQRRGSGESIWDVKRRIGLVSPELHMYFSEPLTAERVAATGFFDVLVARPTTTSQNAAVRDLFAFFGITELSDRPFTRLSSGQQRIVLLIRALIKDPPLLILDEPFQMLDTMTRDAAREWIDTRIGDDRTVLFVTHNEAELPRAVTRRLRLLNGGVVEVK
jgi:molybdate transport system ATP-binding protein